MALPDAEAWVAQGQVTVLAGRRIFVRDRGDGPTILMLHGFPTWSLDWSPVARRLEGVRIVTPDFLGFGWSEKPRTTYAVDEQADIIEALVTTRRLTNVALVAHDFGVIVAQELWRRARAGRGVLKPSSLTLLNSGIVYRAYRPTRAQRLLSTPVLGALLSSRITHTSLRTGLMAVSGDSRDRMEQEFEALWAGISRQGGHRLAWRLLRYNAERRRRAPEWEAALRDYRGPLSLVWGLDDPVSGAHVLEPALAAYAPRRVVSLPGVGHYPQIEAPEAVAEAIMTNARQGWTG